MSIDYPRSWIPVIGELVWAKVRSHPWWPARIFDPVLASKKAKLFGKEGHILVAFFGDETFNWMKPQELLPFAPHFKEKSSGSNQKLFLSAITESMEYLEEELEHGNDAAPSCDLTEPGMPTSKVELSPDFLLGFLRNLALDPRQSDYEKVSTASLRYHLLMWRLHGQANSDNEEITAGEDTKAVNEEEDRNKSESTSDEEDLIENVSLADRMKMIAMAAKGKEKKKRKQKEEDVQEIKKKKKRKKRVERKDQGNELETTGIAADQERSMEDAENGPVITESLNLEKKNDGMDEMDNGVEEKHVEKSGQLAETTEETYQETVEMVNFGKTGPVASLEGEQNVEPIVRNLEAGPLSKGNSIDFSQRATTASAIEAMAELKRLATHTMAYSDAADSQKAHQLLLEYRKHEFAKGSMTAAKTAIVNGKDSQPLEMGDVQAEEGQKVRTGGVLEGQNIKVELEKKKKKKKKVKHHSTQSMEEDVEEAVNRRPSSLFKKSKQSRIIKEDDSDDFFIVGEKRNKSIQEQKKQKLRLLAESRRRKKRKLAYDSGEDFNTRMDKEEEEEDDEEGERGSSPLHASGGVSAALLSNPTTATNVKQSLGEERVVAGGRIEMEEDELQRDSQLKRSKVKILSPSSSFRLLQLKFSPRVSIPSEPQLRVLFLRYGALERVRVNTSTKFGLVTFTRQKDAESALLAVKKGVILGRQVIEKAQLQQPMMVQRTQAQKMSRRSVPSEGEDEDEEEDEMRNAGRPRTAIHFNRREAEYQRRLQMPQVQPAGTPAVLSSAASSTFPQVPVMGSVGHVVQQQQQQQSFQQQQQPPQMQQQPISVHMHHTHAPSSNGPTTYLSPTQGPPPGSRHSWGMPPAPPPPAPSSAYQQHSLPSVHQAPTGVNGQLQAQPWRPPAPVPPPPSFGVPGDYSGPKALTAPPGFLPESSSNQIQAQQLPATISLPSSYPSSAPPLPFPLPSSLPPPHPNTTLPQSQPPLSSMSAPVAGIGGLDVGGDLLQLLFQVNKVVTTAAQAKDGGT